MSTNIIFTQYYYMLYNQVLYLAKILVHSKALGVKYTKQ